MSSFHHEPDPTALTNEMRTRDDLAPRERGDLAPRGRGAGEDLLNRFTELEIVPDAEGLAAAAAAAGDDEIPGPTTRFYRDASRSILATNDSPDVAFRVSVNPYRGCEHGCIYCYARPTHEYFGLSPGLDFESRIFVKERAPQLLRDALMDRKWEPQVVAMSGVTDCYQPIERRLKLTRGCLEVFAEFRNPVGIVTKNALVQRDADVLQELARRRATVVAVSVTTLDEKLAAVMEPRASRPAKRIETIATLSKGGIPVSVMLGPMIPGLTDHEIPSIVAAAADAGATSASWLMVRLPFGVKDLFQSWLARHRPERKEKVLSRLRDLRGGKLNDPRFGVRMRGEGPFAAATEQLFEAAVAKHGLGKKSFDLNTRDFRKPGPRQLGLY